jgi:hypothetical protein
MSSSTTPDRPEPIVAIGLLTQQDLDMLGGGFRRAFMIDDTPCFEELLSAIDAAERKLEQGAASN